MATDKQINANRKNAQHSCGATSEEGAKRSSQNGLKHGFCGLTLVVTDAEKEAYEIHVEQTFIDYGNPANHQQIQLLQQLADQHWSLHQIFVQQANVISRMNALDTHQAEIGDLMALTRMLNTLNLYEVRRRRAAKQTEEDLLARQKACDAQMKKDLAQAAMIYKSYKAQGKPFNIEEFGFVCSSEDLASYLEGQQIVAANDDPEKQAPKSDFRKLQEDFLKQTTQMEAEADEMMAKLRR